MNIFPTLKKAFVRALLIVAAYETTAYLFKKPLLTMGQTLMFLGGFTAAATLLNLLLDYFFGKEQLHD